MLFLLIACVGLLVVPVAAQAQSESAPPAQTPSDAPAQPAQPSPVTPPGPAERPFVPPQPPTPSQTRIPGAFPEAMLTGTGPPIELHPTISLVESYSDNFNNSGGGSSGSGGSGQTSNLRSTLRGGLNVLINAPRTSGFITLNVAANNDSSDHEKLISLYTYGLTGTIRHVFDPRLSLTITDSLNHTDEFSEGDSGGLRTQRREFTSNTLSFSVGWLIDLISTQSYYRVSTFFSEDSTVSHILGFNASTPIGALNTLQVGYEFTMRSTESGERATRGSATDSIGHRVFGAFNRRLGAYSTMGLSSSYSMTFTGDNETSIWNGSLTGSYGVPMGLTVSSSAGLSIIRSERGGSSSSATGSSSGGSSSTSMGFSTNTLLAYRWAFATASLGIFQDFRQTADEGQDFGIVVTRSLTGTFNYQLTPFISTALRGSFSRNETTGDGNSGSARATTVMTGGASVNWQIVPWLRMTLDYAHTQRSSDNKTELTTSSDNNNGNNRTGGGSRTDSKENRATLTVTATF